MRSIYENKIFTISEIESSRLSPWSSTLKRRKSVRWRKFALIRFTEIKIINEHLRVAAMFVYVFFLRAPVDFEIDSLQRYFTPIIGVTIDRLVCFEHTIKRRLVFLHSLLFWSSSGSSGKSPEAKDLGNTHGERSWTMPESCFETKSHVQSWPLKDYYRNQKCSERYNQQREGDVCKLFEF